jgi:hypothetical protein
MDQRVVVFQGFDAPEGDGPVTGDEDRPRSVLDAALSPLADSLRTEAASIE